MQLQIYLLAWTMLVVQYRSACVRAQAWRAWQCLLLVLPHRRDRLMSTCSGRPGCCLLLQAAWLAYFRSMQNNGFDADTPIYVASGLLTYLNSEGVPSGSMPCVRHNCQWPQNPSPGPATADTGLVSLCCASDNSWQELCTILSLSHNFPVRPEESNRQAIKQHGALPVSQEFP